jgi:hypothetical protein
VTLAQGLYHLAVVTYNRSEFDKSLGYLERAREADPGFLDAYCLTAGIYLRLNDRRKTEEWCRKALELDLDCSAAYRILAQLDLSGPDYVEILSRIHVYLRPRTYLEIGVAYGETLMLAGGETRAIGVDPLPQVTQSLAPPTKVCAMTSDEFFAAGILERELGGDPVELAFIDGMHLFEFALRDFINVERYCASDSVILVHDCFPLDQVTAARERQTLFWSGDVWKLILCLKRYRPDLDIQVIGAMPTGLALITGLNPESRLLEQEIERLYAEFINLDYRVLDHDKESMLNLIANEWGGVEQILAQRRRGNG